jgi:hypothetical protein
MFQRMVIMALFNELSATVLLVPFMVLMHRPRNSIGYRSFLKGLCGLGFIEPIYPVSF